MSSRKHQSKNRRKQQRNVGAENENDFMDDEASTSSSNRRNRDARQRAPAGKPGKKPKQERRRNRRREESESFEESFVNFPWENLFQSDLGVHLAEILAGFSRLKTRIGNNVTWIATARVLYELLRYVDDYMLTDSLLLPVLSGLTLLIGVRWTNYFRPMRWGIAANQLLFLTVVFLTAITTVISAWRQFAGDIGFHTIGKLIVGTVLVQIATCCVMEKSSFGTVDLGSVLVGGAVVTLAYPAAVASTGSLDKTSLQLCTLLFTLGFSAGSAKILVTRWSLPGSFHRVALGKHICTLWGVLVVIVLCRIPYGAVLFHLICRYLTLVFLNSADTTINQKFKISGEPKFDFIHMILEVLLHALALGQAWYSCTLVLLVALVWLARRWELLHALQRLSFRPLLAVFTLACALRILSFVLLWIIQCFPRWISCVLEPLTLWALSLQPQLLTYLSLYSPPPMRLH